MIGQKPLTMQKKKVEIIARDYGLMGAAMMIPGMKELQKQEKYKQQVKSAAAVVTGQMILGPRYRAQGGFE
jgi:hypothetical protein